MKIITWEASEGDTPEKWRWTARIETNGSFLPVTFHGATKEAVTDKASSFWEDELGAARVKNANALAAAEKRKATRAATKATASVDDDDEEVV